ncbi:MAG: CDP-alcohol phosphatidyltransferase family protein, partial [Prevotella sp.]|nr:CDP-alcohol phosphatidyltransferase family protein [Prevotella sp.]
MKKHIPNMITCCNLISGCIATVMAIYGDAGLALLWIVVGAVFDFFDGMTARLLHVSSPIGKELDSLADDVTFGVAPSAILYQQLSVMDWPAALQTTLVPYSSMTWAQVLSFAAFIMAAFSALRLAKFNLDERQAMGFIGLPTPANALYWGSLIVGTHRWLDQLPGGVVTLLVMMFFSCYLLVSE